MPHLHFVDLRPQEKLIDKVLFNADNKDSEQMQAPKTQVKVIHKHKFWGLLRIY